MDLWGWRGCFIVYSGIILNGVVCASVFRPVVITHVVDLGTPVAEHKASQHQNGLNNGKTKEPSPILEEPETEENTTLLNGGNSHHTSLRVLNHLSYKRPQLLNQICTASDSKLKTVGRTVPDEVILPKRYRSETFCVGTPTFTEKQAVRRHVNGHDQIEYAVRLKPFELKDIFLSGSLTNLPNQQQLSHPHTVYHRADSSTMVPTNEIVDAVELSQPQKASVWAELRTGMAEMTDFSILRDPVYLLFAVSNFLTNIGYDLPRVFLPTYAQPFNISKSDSPWLVSAWGIANTIGRVFVGWLADQRWAMPHRLWIYNFSLVICGIVNFCAPLCRDFPSLLVYSILFGFTLSKFSSILMTVDVVKFVSSRYLHKPHVSSSCGSARSGEAD